MPIIKDGKMSTDIMNDNYGRLNEASTRPIPKPDKMDPENAGIADKTPYGRVGGGKGSMDG